MSSDVRFLRLPVPPSTNRYWRLGNHFKQVVSKEAIAYKKLLSVIVPQMGIRPFPAGSILVARFVWYRGMVTGDANNRDKILSDALQGLVFADDNSVIEWRYRAIDSKSKKGQRKRSEIELAVAIDGSEWADRIMNARTFSLAGKQ